MIMEYLRELRADLKSHIQDESGEFNRINDKIDRTNERVHEEAADLRAELSKMGKVIAQHKTMITLISSGIALAVSWGYAYLVK